MDLEENRAGLDSLAFHHTYKEIYDYPLELQSYGFVNLYDMLHHGLGDSLLLTLDQFGGLRIASNSAAPSVTDEFKEKVKQVLLLLVLLLDGLLAPLKPDKLPNNQHQLPPGLVQRLCGTVQLPGGQTPENVTRNIFGSRFF